MIETMSQSAFRLLKGAAKVVHNPARTLLELCILDIPGAPERRSPRIESSPEDHSKPTFGDLVFER